MASNDRWEDIPSQAAGDGWEDIPAQGPPEPLKKRLNRALTESAKAGLEKVGKAANWLDAYTGAPLRSAAGAALDLKNPLSAAIDQFGSDNTKAPSGAELAAKLGIPNQDYEATQAKFDPHDPNFYDPNYVRTAGTEQVAYNPAKMAGLPIEMALDATNAIPALGAAKRAALSTKLGERLAQKAGQKAMTAAVEFGHAATGVPARDIETYIRKTPEINQIISESGANPAVAANLKRESWMDDLQKTRKEANSEITQALHSAPKDEVLPASPILASLEKAKASLDPVYEKKALAEIDDLIAHVQEASPQGMTNLPRLQKAKNFFYEAASGSYQKNGQVFNPSDATQRAAKGAAAEAKNLLDSLGPESMKKANQTLAELHEFEDTAKKNLFTPETPEAALLAAGAGSNVQNRETLKRLGQILGRDTVSEAEALSSARSFGDPKLLPVDTTGKAALRTGLLAKLGHMMGGTPGAIALGGLSSPAALKIGVNAGRSLDAAASRFGVSARDALPKLLGARAVGFTEREQERKKKKGPWSALQEKDKK